MNAAMIDLSNRQGWKTTAKTIAGWSIAIVWGGIRAAGSLDGLVCDDTNAAITVGG